MNENRVPDTANQAAAQRGNGKKPGKLLLIGGIAVAAVAVAALLTTVVASALTSPMTLVGKSISNSAEVLEDHPVVELLGDVAEGGSVELVVELDRLMGAILGYDSLSLDGQVSLKVYSDTEDGRGAAVALLELDGKRFLDASVLASGEEIVVTSDSLLEGEAYGIALNEAAEKFEGSVFGPDGYLSLGIDSIDAYVDCMQLSKTLEEDAKLLSEDLIKVVLKSINEHAEITKENDELSFNGESTRVTAVEVVLDDDAFAAVVADVVEYLREDENVEAFVEKYAELAEMQMRAEYDAETDYYARYYDIYTYEEYCEYFYGGRRDFVEEFYEALDEIEDELDDFDEFDKLTAVFYITKGRKELVGVDLKVKADGETDKIALRAGPTLKDMTEIVLRVDSGDDQAVISYEVDVNDKTQYSAELVAESNDYEILSVTVDWDKEDGDLAVMLTAEGGYIECKGSLEVTDESAVLVMDSLNASGEILQTEAVLTLTVSDEIPELFDEYTDFLSLTNRDLEQLGAQIGAQLMTDFYALDGDTMRIIEMLLGF